MDVTAAVEFLQQKRSQIWLGPNDIRTLQLYHDEFIRDSVVTLGKHAPYSIEEHSL